MPSIKKIHKILDLLREYYRNGLTNKEISDKLKIPPSTCYRILADLRKYDLVYQRKPDLRYFLGFAHLRYAEALREGMDIASVSLPYLDHLHIETGETVFLTLLNGTSCVVMEMCGFTNMRVSVGLGEVMPLHCSASGKAVFAFLQKEIQERILRQLNFKRYTEKTKTSQEYLKGEIQEIQKTGVAFNIEEFNTGINAMATPLFNRQANIIGSIALVGTSASVTRERMEQYAPLFIDASIQISQKIGGSFPKTIANKFVPTST